MTSEAKKRVIIVTGASRGLGREIALRFGKAGEKVVVSFLARENDATAVARDIIFAGGDAMTFKADVRNADAVDEMLSETLKRWGALDVLVNNAGIANDGLLLRMAEPDWDDVLNTNLKGPFHTIRAASRAMMKGRRGHVINISSIVGIQGRAGQANYSASKAGLIGLTKAAAKELGRLNIQVNAVLPGYLPTEMGEAVSDAVLDRVMQENTLGRISDPAEVADFIYQLSLMNNVSGQVFNLDSRIL